MQFIIIILHLHRFYEPLIHLKSWPKDMHWMGIGHQFNSLVSTLSPYESYLSSFITISWSKSLQLLISVDPVYCLMARADGATVPCTSWTQRLVLCWMWPGHGSCAVQFAACLSSDWLTRVVLLEHDTATSRNAAHWYTQLMAAGVGLLFATFVFWNSG